MGEQGGNMAPGEHDINLCEIDNTGTSRETGGEETETWGVLFTGCH